MYFHRGVFVFLAYLIHDVTTLLRTHDICAGAGGV